VITFFGFLAWLGLLGSRLWCVREGAVPDRVLGAALPGIAALTAVGGAYATIMSVRDYATVVWLLVGITLSAAYDGPVRRQLRWLGRRREQHAS
jgi:hypothetical protein